jgi:hypothetical protein
MYNVFTICFTIGMRHILKDKIGPTSSDRVRHLLFDPQLPTRHRKRDKDFTRTATLTFPVLMLFLLRKGVKSLQTRLHDFLWALNEEATAEMVTSGAVTHARAKLNGSAFVELNEEAVLKLFYGPEYEPIVELWRGHRLLGVDGSIVRLPQSPSVREAFGVVGTENQYGKVDEYPEGRMSVLYDLLNRIGLEGRLVSSRIGETALAIEHLKQTREGDVLVADRGYSGYLFFAEVLENKRDFVCRGHDKSFAVVNQLFARNEEGISVKTQLRAHSNLVKKLEKRGLPRTITVRFVTVRLPGGELEVLATSLLDETKYPTAEVGEVYGFRWGHETYYGMLKGALDLENFSGKTPEALEQDFQSTVFLANMQTLLLLPVEAELAERSKGLKNPLTVNRSVAIHAIKNRAVDLLASDKPIDEVVAQLRKWFMKAPNSIQVQRKVPRPKRSLRRAYNFQKRSRKFVF